MISRSEAFDAERIIVSKNLMFDLIDRLNASVYEIMDEYELTQQSRDRALRENRREGEKIIQDANHQAEDIYAASVLYTEEALNHLHSMVEEADDTIGRLYRKFQKDMKQQEDTIRENHLELKSQLQLLSDTNKYLRLIEDRNREIERERKDRKGRKAKAKDVRNLIKPEIKINEEYFRKAGIPFEKEEEKPQPEEDISEDILIQMEPLEDEGVIESSLRKADEIPGRDSSWKGSIKKTENAENEDEIRKAEEAKRTDEIRKAEEIKRADEIRKAEEVKRAEEVRKASEIKETEGIRKSDEIKETEEIRKSGEIKGTEEVRKSGEIKGTDKIRTAEELKRAEEIRTVKEINKAEEIRTAEQINRTEEIRTDEIKKAEEIRTAEQINRAKEVSQLERAAAAGGEIRTAADIRESGVTEKDNTKDAGLKKNMELDDRSRPQQSENTDRNSSLKANSGLKTNSGYLKNTVTSSDISLEEGTNKLAGSSYLESAGASAGSSYLESAGASAGGSYLESASAGGSYPASGKALSGSSLPAEDRVSDRGSLSDKIGNTAGEAFQEYADMPAAGAGNRDSEAFSADAGARNSFGISDSEQAQPEQDAPKVPAIDEELVKVNLDAEYFRWKQEEEHPGQKQKEKLSLLDKLMGKKKSF